MGLRVSRKIVVRFCHRECLDKLILIQNSVGFPRTPAGGYVFDRGTYKYDRTAVISYAVQCELVHEAFDVKLPQHELLHRFVVTEKACVFMRFTFRVLFLRWIDRFIPHMNKSIVYHKNIFSLGLARADTATHPLHCRSYRFRAFGFKRSVFLQLEPNARPHCQCTD